MIGRASCVLSPPAGAHQPPRAPTGHPICGGPLWTGHGLPDGYRHSLTHSLPGAYIFLRVDVISSYEWHPFTISSAPEASRPPPRVPSPRTHQAPPPACHPCASGTLKPCLPPRVRRGVVSTCHPCASQDAHISLHIRARGDWTRRQRALRHHARVIDTLAAGAHRYYPPTCHALCIRTFCVWSADVSRSRLL